MADDLRLGSLDIERDAEALAKMWNESDDQWPGSFTGGVPMTVESVTRWYRDEDALDVMIWTNDAGDIAGYCSLQRETEEESVGYVHVLNVHPAYQKRSLGRRFLTTAVERCVKLGLRRLDLHTWPGNLKAVPLYKKTGFFWVPDTDVFMMNFVPAALQSPCAEPYFARHDWYATFDRQLAQVEDDERWWGMKVFTYRWREGEDALAVWADREGRAITAMETNDFFAAAIPDSVGPAKGVEVPMRWEVRNKRDTPLPVSLVARGTEHLKLDYRDVMLVPPGETVIRSAKVAVDAKTPTVRAKRVTPKIESLLLIDGKLLELGTGLRPEPAVVVDVIPRQVMVAPGAPCRVNVQLRYVLDVPVKASVHLVAPDGLEIDRSTADVELGPRAQSGLPVTARANEPGAYAIQALVDFCIGDDLGHAAPQELVIMAAFPGQPMAYGLEDEVLVVSGEFAYRVKREGGRVEWRNLAADEYAGHSGGELGPPFDPPDLEPQKAKLSLRRDGQGVVVTSEHTSKRFPGLVLYRDWHFAGGPLIRVVHRTANIRDADLEAQYSAYIGRQWAQEHAITLPLVDGLLHAKERSFPSGDQDVPREVNAYAERWVALESTLATVGVIWDEGFSEVRCHWGTSFRKAPYRCPAHGWAEPYELWLYVGPGGWRGVQSAYAYLSGTPQERLLRDVGRVTEVGLRPAVPVLQSGESRPSVRIQHRRQRELMGAIKLSAPSGWRVEPAELEFAGVDREHPFDAPVVLSYDGGAPGPGAYELRMAL